MYNALQLQHLHIMYVFLNLHWLQIAKFWHGSAERTRCTVISTQARPTIFTRKGPVDTILSKPISP